MTTLVAKVAYKVAEIKIWYGMLENITMESHELF